MRILIVDDHDILRDALSVGLRSSGHDVTQAQNGLDALNAMEERLPDVLVTDLDMPVMGGAELIKAVRRTHPTLPIVAMTAGSLAALAAIEDVQSHCKLEKPFTAVQLIGAIEHACEAP